MGRFSDYHHVSLCCSPLVLVFEKVLFCNTIRGLHYIVYRSKDMAYPIIVSHHT